MKPKTVRLIYSALEQIAELVASSGPTLELINLCRQAIESPDEWLMYQKLLNVGLRQGESAAERQIIAIAQESLKTLLYSPDLWPKSGEIKVEPFQEISKGDHFGLWEVSGEPTVSKAGRVTAYSKYPCTCRGCGDTYMVTRRYLLEGNSKGCKLCRVTAPRPEAKPGKKLTGLPCPTCEQATRKVGKRTTKKGQMRDYYCIHCKKQFSRLIS